MIEPLGPSGAFLYTPRRFSDERGWFSETYNKRALQEALGGVEFVQDNQSFSSRAFTLRGMHFQVPPKAQGKLIRVLRGSVLDVIVDIRTGSPTYGKAAQAKLTAEGGEQLYAPPGMAHGFLTLEPNVEVLYKVTDYYDKASERGLLWRDPALAIQWPNKGDVHIVERDDAFPPLAELGEFFQYQTSKNTTG